MKIKTNLTEYENDLNDMVKLFFPLYGEEQNLEIEHEFTEDENKETNVFKIDGKEFVKQISKPKKESKKQKKMSIKLALYEVLEEYTKKTLLWGILTGVRPTKIAYELLENGTPKHLLKETLMKEYKLSEEKATILKNVIKNQNCIIKNDKLIDFYINIPICPTKCEYCSFISSEYCKVVKILPTYLEMLKKEIRAAKKIIFDNCYVVRSIYMGGGTPTILNAEQLDDLLSELSYPVNEFTVEAGRPETISRDKLEILKKHNVTRICINPQSFNERTLKKIGRKHTVEDIISAYKLGLEFNFNINMDLIAGLPGEKFPSFKKSLNCCLEMSPTNITVHTLALKKGAELIKTKEDLTSEKDIEKMITFSNKRLTEEGYEPYYIYRLKNMLNGMENVGYTKPKGVCVFNVDSMEETCSVIACGANAISKRVFHIENKIERCANVKYLEDYISRIDEMIERKKQLFS